MLLAKEEWYESIFQRRSRRLFTAEPLTDEEVSRLTDFSQQLNKNIAGARVEIITQNPEDVFKGVIGSYGKIKGAPAYAAFIGNLEDANMQEKVGYIGECLILEAASMGLATCWVGGFFRPDIVKQQIAVAADEKVLAVTPLGYASKQYGLKEKLMSGFVSSHKRKDLDFLCVGGFRADWPDWVKSALELARLAPSAVNRQPWRFSVEPNAIKISVDNVKDTYNISKRLDCGIAMVHIEVGAKHKGVNGKWNFLNQPDVAVYTLE